jgi:hypothetical protein
VRGYNKKLIRDLLAKHPDGLTLRQISKQTGITIDSCINSLKRCYGCYVSHWQESAPDNKMLCQVWKCVSVPENAPKPKKKRTPEQIKEYQAAYRMKIQNERLERQMKRDAEKYEKELAAKRSAKKPAKKVKAPVFTSTGMTQIRGPWPAWS